MRRHRAPKRRRLKTDRKLVQARQKAWQRGWPPTEDDTPFLPPDGDAELEGTDE